jgi:hypothetical protein
VDRISRRFRDVKLNENIILIDPYDPKSKIIRSVKGVEKQWVKVEDDDGTEFMAFIPKGYLWLEHSGNKVTEAEFDSKEFGPVPKGLILGRPLGTLWRLSSTSFPVGRVEPTTRQVGSTGSVGSPATEKGTPPNNGE